MHPDRRGAALVRALVATIVVASIAWAMPGAAGASDSYAWEGLVGVWLRVDSPGDEARRSEAIARATAGLSAPIRAIARGVMRRSVEPVDRYEIRRAEPGLSIRADSADPVTARLDGERDRDPDAEVRSRPLEDGFEQIWRSDDSTHGRTHWQLVAGPRRLVVTTHVEDDRFSAPLVYSASYERVGREARGRD